MQIINYITTNPVETLAAVFSIGASFGMSDKWKYTPSIMFTKSALWAIWGLCGGFMVVFFLNGTLAILSAVNQYKWLKKEVK